MVKKYLTATNILILVIVLCYVLDKYIIPIPVGYDGFTWNEYTEGSPFLISLLGFCGGRLTDLFGIIGTELTANGHAFYRYFTIVFVHVYILHLIVNMIGLYIAGNFVEKKLGSALTIILFFITGAISVFVTNPLWTLVSGESLDGQICAGASGAIFGIIGIALVICILNKNNFKDMTKTKKIILAIYGIVFTYIANGFISWTMFAHNSGFIVGMIVMGLLYFIPSVKGKVNN